jgi:methyltransferase (TIGR00027 family)
MRADRPSLTAQRVAMSRAAHQVFDHPRVLEDPLALRIIGPESAQAVCSNGQRYSGRLARYLRAFLVARSRVAEDALADALGRGVHQYVVLGAGLDTFAYRNPYGASALRVFEVDHPQTQDWKRRQLSAAGLAIPQALTFVPIDFEAQTLADELHRAGFCTDEASFFSWLGVSMYLTRESVLSTLRYVASRPAGSGIAFDYAVSPRTLTFIRRLGARALMSRVAAIGEPWKTFFEPGELAAELRTLGFGHTQDLGAGELNARFFSERTDGLRVAGLGRVMCARR